MAEKEGGIVKKGHEEGLKLAVTLLEEFGLPLGLLPLADVIEVGFVKSTGYMWILQSKNVEHNFQMISKLVSYDSEITGYVEMKRIKKLKGVKAKELMLWPPVSEITADDPPTGKIHFKSLAGITKTFPVEAFAAGDVAARAVHGDFPERLVLREHELGLDVEDFSPLVDCFPDLIQLVALKMAVAEMRFGMEFWWKKF
ncbi:hypothetical protein F0562_029483 [Nyssa sinensis]|uniref:Uncharacterized protein n=1 Tax=Nyssa sinensis TaxID=561372 RepID=A0A5J5B166_9ASTE|nr:hypothetical protein F0562_029483 [Nyssa sinensis]